MTILANTRLMNGDGTASREHFLALLGLAQQAKRAEEASVYAYGALQADYTLTSTTDPQKLFNWSTAGALRLVKGVYRYRGKIVLTGMSATSGNGQFRLGGTATIADAAAFIIGGDTTSPDGAVGSITGGYFTGVTSAADMVTATTGTGLVFWVDGKFTVTAAGTVIPQIALTTAAAATVEAGSDFEVGRVADAPLIGPWA